MSEFKTGQRIRVVAGFNSGRRGVVLCPCWKVSNDTLGSWVGVRVEFDDGSRCVALPENLAGSNSRKRTPVEKPPTLEANRARKLAETIKYSREVLAQRLSQLKKEKRTNENGS